MTKGLLVVDQKMNTLIIPMDSDELSYWMKHKVDMSKIHQHKTLKELDKDVRAYLYDTYEEEE